MFTFNSRARATVFQISQLEQRETVPLADHADGARYFVIPPRRTLSGTGVTLMLIL